MRAAGTFRQPAVLAREDDTAERVVRRFFEACEAARGSGRTERLLRRMARSALGGSRSWRVLNALVSNRFSTLVGIDDRAQRMQLVSAHLLGIAYARYVFAVEPLASLPVERVIALSLPVVQHYLAEGTTTAGRARRTSDPRTPRKLPPQTRERIVQGQPQNPYSD